MKKRFVWEYKNWKIRQLINLMYEGKISEEDYKVKFYKISDAEIFCERGLLSIDEAMKIIAEA